MEFNGGVNVLNLLIYEVLEFNGGVNGEFFDLVEVFKI